MSTSMVAPAMVELVGRLIGSAVTAVERLSGASLTATTPEILDAIEPTEAAATVATRVPLIGLDAAGSITVAVPGSGHKLDPAQVAAAMVGGAVEELGSLTGTQISAGTPEAVADTAAAAVGATVVRFEVGTAAGHLPIHWLLDASLVQRLFAPPPAPPPPPQQEPTSAPTPAAFPELNGNAGPGAARDLALLSDVPMDVTVELGKTVLQVRDLLSLREGSVVELDRGAGASVDVLVNGTLIARGDVVVIDDDLGVRVTEIIRH